VFHLFIFYETKDSKRSLYSSHCVVDLRTKDARGLYVQVTVHRDNLRINNQQDASSIQNLILSRNSHVSGIFCVHHQELTAVHVANGMFHAGYVAAA
jgi:hypothetical protein